MQLRRLDELARHALRVKLHDAHGQAVRFGIVLAVAGLALLQQLRRVWRQRQALLECRRRCPGTSRAAARRWATGGGAPRCPVGAPRQTPEKSGLPSAVLGAGRSDWARRAASWEPDESGTSATARGATATERRRCAVAPAALIAGVHVQSPRSAYRIARRRNRSDGTKHVRRRECPRTLGRCCARAPCSACRGPLSAHHSFAAEYDANRPLTVTGTVTKLEWTNPHARVFVDAKDESGKIVHWDFELGPPNGLMRRGWSRNSLKPGHVVTVTGFHSKTEPTSPTPGR